MKILFYDTRKDEEKLIAKTAEKLNLAVEYIPEMLNSRTAKLAKGYDGISVLGNSRINAQALLQLNKYQIKYVSTRTIGYNHIDIAYAKQLGIKVANSSYAPNGVAEFTVMLMLMSVRHYKQALFRGNVNDYSLSGLQGREMKDLTVGVLGSGKIGSAVIECLQGFGCRILAYDPYPNEKVKEKADFVDIDTLYKESNIITLHMPLLKETYHMINKTTINAMKPGVVLINCARGGLMDINAVIEGIETQKIGALGLDVFENEEGIYHQDRRTDIIANREMAYLRQFPNVTMTQHMAFYTDAAVENMVIDSMENLLSFIQNGTCKNEI